MKSTFTAERNEKDACVDIHIVLDDRDYADLDIDQLDYMILFHWRDREKTPAEYLHGLAYLFRLLERQESEAALYRASVSRKKGQPVELAGKTEAEAK